MILGLILFLLNLSPSLAAGEFSYTQKINYYFDSSGNATVRHEYEVTNNLSQIYPEEYHVELPFDNLNNIVGQDDTGNIISDTQIKNNHTYLTFKFNRPGIGKNQSTKFKLNYRQNNLAKRKGNTWEIQLPQQNSQNTDGKLDISLDLPLSFGNLSYASISTPNPQSYSNRQSLTLDYNQIKDQPVLLIFGNYQLFDFTLSYYLLNDKNYLINTQIAIPPDTQGQEIIYSRLSPPPSNVVIDTDGNYLASYQIPATQSLEVKITGQAKIFPPLRLPVQIDPALYLTEQEYWPVSSPVITKISTNLTTPKKIYDYVVNKLSYDYSISSPNRKGALPALSSPTNSLCTEFVDLFVTLARAKGIPAREIEGFAYTNNPEIKPISANTDILHAWAEYYDSSQKVWIGIDPTWGKTTHGIDYFHDLDLNHFTFVIHGLDSQSPPPPGSFKKDSSGKTVIVNFASQNLTKSNSPLIGDFSKDQLTIANPNNYTLKDISLSLPDLNWSTTIPAIPPFGRLLLDTPKPNFLQSLLPRWQKIPLLIQAKNQPPQTLSPTNYQHYFNLGITITVIITLLSISGIILTILKPKSLHEKNS